MLFIFLKYLHIFGVVLLLGSIFTLDLMTLRLILLQKNPALQIFYSESKFIEKAIIAPSTIITIVSGIVMSFLWFGWPFWITWGMIVVIFTGVTGSTVIPRMKKQLSELISSNSADQQLIKKLTIKFIWLISTDLILLFSALGTMVYKPTF